MTKFFVQRRCSRSQFFFVFGKGNIEAGRLLASRWINVRMNVLPQSQTLQGAFKSIFHENMFGCFGELGTGVRGSSRSASRVLASHLAAPVLLLAFCYVKQPIVSAWRSCVLYISPPFCFAGANENSTFQLAVVCCDSQTGLVVEQHRFFRLVLWLRTVLRISRVASSGGSENSFSRKPCDC